MSAPENTNRHALDSTTPIKIVNLLSSHIVKKKWFDFALIVLLSPVIVPLMLIIALLIKYQSKGPIFFWQKRVGYQGKVFNMVKFRSMSTDSEKNGPQFTENRDARITPFGHFIRKVRIDELPQLWNVVRGEMSLIGPRPEQIVFVEEFKMTIPNYMDRYKVLPGITGLSQVKQGYVDDTEGTRTRLKYDLFYINNISYKLDIYIVFQTIYTMATGYGAR